MLAFIALALAIPSPAEVREVRRDLAVMASEDQAIRKAVSGSSMTREEREVLRLRMQEVDRRNTRRLKQFVERWGWIRKSVFGERAAKQAWMLAQHADHDRAWQRRVLALLESALAENEVDRRDVAYLTDRLLVGEGRPQRYGTQGLCTGPGTWEPHDIEAPDDVDARRAALGLESLAAYRRRFATLCREDERPSFRERKGDASQEPKPER